MSQVDVFNGGPGRCTWRNHFCLGICPAQFESFDNDGPVLIWVTIRSYPNEGPWQACRRVYQRDVFQVSDRPGNRVRCRIDHSRIYQPGEVRQNFNRH